FAGVILPIVITLIVITVSVFSLMVLYKMCQKKTPGIWFAFPAGGRISTCFLLIKDLFWITLTIISDKEGVKLLSVKTTSPETGECFLCVYVCF
ncbi:MUCEN protein, partial [Brachypodius atriceps]|nr:MUCEN protein [Brachypodius atriceps]